MRQHRKSAVLAAGGVVVMLTAGACGGGGSKASVAPGGAITKSSTSGSSGTSGSKQSSTKGSKGSISWWVPGPDPIPGTLQAAASAFTKKTGIGVSFDQSPWSTYQTKLTTAITSGQGPDVAEIGNTWASTFAHTNGFLSWTPSMYKAIGGQSKFVATSESVTGAPNQTPISVPFLGQTWLLEYNKTMFKAAGISEPPTSWATFMADAKKLSDPAKGVYGIGTPLGAPTADATWDWIVMSQQGGGYYNSKGTADVTSSIDAKVLSDYVQWVYPDKIVNPALVSDSTGTLATTEFERGQAAMLLTQDPQQAVADPAKYGIGYVPVPAPLPAGGSDVMSHVAGENLVIFKTSKHLSLDLEFINFLTSPAEQEAINKAMYELPVTTAGLDTSYFQTPAEKVFGEILSKHAQPMPEEASSAQLQNLIGPLTVNLFRKAAANGTVTPSQAASALNTAQQTLEAQSGS